MKELILGKKMRQLKHKNKKSANYHFWSDEIKAHFIKLFPDTTNKELMEIFNLTYSMVANMANRLGLKKSQRFRSNIFKESYTGNQHSKKP